MISPSSSGCLRVSRSDLSNSRNSSRKRTPLCASDISPGFASRHHPMIEASLAVWCIIRNGRSVTIGISFERSQATEYIFESSICSSISIEGSIPERARASMVFPDHGGHCMRILCPPAADMRSARFACSWPCIDAKSMVIVSRGRLMISSFSDFTISFTQVRVSMTSLRFSTPITSISGITDASGTFARGTNTCFIPSSLASITAGRAHWIWRTSPSSASSPRKS